MSNKRRKRKKKREPLKIWKGGKRPPGSISWRDEVSNDEGTVIMTGFITPKGILVVTDIDTVGVKGMDSQVSYREKRKQEVDITWALELIRDIQDRKWFGTLTFIFEAGEVRRARKDESLKPPSAKVKTSPNLH